MKIEKIYSQLDNYQNQLNANKEKFEKIYNENISSWIELRNIILTLITALAGFSGFTFAVTDLNYSSMSFLIILVIVGIGVYIGFFFLKRERNKKVLEILNEFHDGFTTISFMKGFLDKISLVFENLEPKQIDVLNDYYTMVQGGIAFKIRSKIEKSVQGGIAFQIRRVITEPVKEAAAYGYIERKLYNMLIYKASKIYKVQEKRGKKEKKEEEELLEKLFCFHNEKYDSLPEDEKKFYNEKYNSLPLKVQIFDECKNVLEIKFLIIGGYFKYQKKDIGKIVEVDIGKIVEVDFDNDESYITIEGHGIHKSYRVGNSTNGLNSISKKRENWLKSLLHLIHHYRIPLDRHKIENWEYGNSVITETDYSKRIDDKGK